jgi:hypothetical protein
MSAPTKVYDLVERFERNLEPYKQGKYNETQVRLEFINPLFEELGWDIANKQGYAEAYKDLVHEDALKVGEAILKGSFDTYVDSKKAKRGTAEVDTAFLQEIERWRDLLARNIALRNPSLSQRELNFAVQRTIDRIIFLRICEDRGIEFYGRLMALQNGTQIYQRMFQLFRQADDRYNSGLFHFRHKVRSVEEFADYRKNADAAKWIKKDRNEFLITLSDIEQDIANKVTRIGGKLSDVMDIQRGVTPFHTTPEKPNINPYLAFRGTVRPYRIKKGERVFIRYDETLAEFKPYKYFNGTLRAFLDRV